MGMKEQEIKQIYTTIDMGSDELGKVQISEEVVASIAALSVKEVEGVHSTVGSITNELVGKLGVKNISKGVKAVIEGENVMIDMNINMRFGYNIFSQCTLLQDKVKETVYNMTGLTVKEVNLRVVDVVKDK